MSKQIFEGRIKLKPGVSAKDFEDCVLKELIPACRNVPGCVDVKLLKGKSEWVGRGSLDWDYAWVEIWETPEAHERALRDGLIGPKSKEMAGLYSKLQGLAGIVSTAVATVVEK